MAKIKTTEKKAGIKNKEIAAARAILGAVKVPKTIGAQGVKSLIAASRWLTLADEDYNKGVEVLMKSYGIEATQSENGMGNNYANHKQIDDINKSVKELMELPVDINLVNADTELAYKLADGLSVDAVELLDRVFGV